MTATRTPAANRLQPIDPQPDDAPPMPNQTDNTLAQIRTELLTTFSAADWESYNHIVGWLRDTDVASHALKVGDAAPDLLLPDAEPRRRVVTEPFRPADRLVTNAEWMEFIEDGGYTKPVLALPAHPRGRRVQWQVHVRAVRFASRFLRDAAGTPPRELAQLFPAHMHWQFAGLRLAGDV